MTDKNELSKIYNRIYLTGVKLKGLSALIESQDTDGTALAGNGDALFGLGRILHDMGHGLQRVAERVENLELDKKPLSDSLN